MGNNVSAALTVQGAVDNSGDQLPKETNMWAHDEVDEMQMNKKKAIWSLVRIIKKLLKHQAHMLMTNGARIEVLTRMWEQ